MIQIFFSFSVQVPKKQIVEKPSRAIERQVIEMERKNRTYTLLEDSDSDGEASREGGKEKKSREKDRGKKRKHLRQKRDESPLSSEDDGKNRWVLADFGVLMENVLLDENVLQMNINTKDLLHNKTSAVKETS